MFTHRHSGTTAKKITAISKLIVQKKEYNSFAKSTQTCSLVFNVTKFQGEKEHRSPSITP
jgi:hypothetical protein